MSNFQKDVQLLTDLQELISDAERTANMPGYAGAVFNAISPALKAAMPAAQKKARRLGGPMMTLNEIRKLRGMTLSEFSRKSGLSPHTARNLMGYRELYGNPRMDTMVDAARALNAVVTITPKGVTIRARKESA